MALDTITKVKGRRAADRTQADGTEVYPWYTREGMAVTMPAFMAWAQEGRVFVGNAGSATAPITFGAGSIDTTEPDFDLLLPAGSAVMVVPLEIEVQMETFGTTAIFEGMAAYGLGGAQSSTGATAVTPKCLRTDAPAGGSVCTVYSNVDAGATYMTQGVAEFMRFGTELIATVQAGDDDSNRLGNTHRWSAMANGFAPILVASGLAARLNVFAAAQAGTGFIRVVWAELPIS